MILSFYLLHFSVVAQLLSITFLSQDNGHGPSENVLSCSQKNMLRKDLFVASFNSLGSVFMLFTSHGWFLSGRWCLIRHQAYPLLIVSQTWKLERLSMIIALSIKLSAFAFSCYIVWIFSRSVVQDVELPNGATFTSVNTYKTKTCRSKMKRWSRSSRTSQLPWKALKTILMGVL